MNVVKKQGILHGIVSILSILLGVVNNLFIYPRFIVMYGFFQSINAVAGLIGPFGQFGLDNVLMKYNDEMVNKNGNMLFRFAAIWLLFSSVIFGAVYFLLIDNFVVATQTYLPYVSFVSSHKVPIFIIMTLLNVVLTLTSISTIYQDVATPHLWYRLVALKMFVPILIVVSALYFEVPERAIVWGFILILIAVIIRLLLLFYVRGQLSFQKVRLKSNTKDIGVYASFGILDRAGSQLAFSIDIIMVKILLGDAMTGIYAIFNFLANVLRVPISAIDGIYNPIVATMWSNGEVGKIQKKYTNASITLFTITLGLFLLIDLSIYDLLTIMKKEESYVGRFVFLFIGIGILMDSVTTLNSHILIYSDSFRWNLYFTLLSALLNIVLTYVFIKYVFEAPLQAAGAACSTAISLIVFNLAKTLYIFIKYKLQPFTIKHILLLVIGIAVYTVVWILPFEWNAYINILLRSVLIVVLFAIPVYFFEVSDEVNKMIRRSLKLIGP